MISHLGAESIRFQHYQKLPFCKFFYIHAVVFYVLV